MVTIEDAKQWAADYATELDQIRLSCDDKTVQMFNRVMPEKSKDLWDSGSWLGEQLRALGATDEQVQSIQMAQGQRAFRGDAWQAAVDHVNEFSEQGDTEEKDGLDLAEKRHEELFGKQNEPTTE